MEGLLYTVWAGLGVRLMVSLYNLISRPQVPPGIPEVQGRLSILIPARNEARSLPTLLALLPHIRYPDYEVIIYDDQSTDETPVLLAAAAAAWPRLRIITGTGLPEGWLGKNHACHQLAQAATGAYLLFLDADICQLDPDYPAALVAEMQRREVTLLSVFPDQRMETWGEKATIPVMFFLLLPLLPLWWIYRLPFPSMAAANGQCMLFEGSAYRAYRWHERVRTVIVEDIAIMQQVKTLGLRGMTYTGGGRITCHMYRSYQEGIAGFSKNILAGFGNSIPGLVVFLLLVWGCWLLLAPYLTGYQLLISIGMIAGIRITSSLTARMPVWESLWMHPVHMVSLVWIGISAVNKRLSGRNVWKGRNV
ncbi:MAG: glycosyltransferase family 2 protein [Bacteroidia bacterium]|jgi:chlorobactene glucosyltransferase|nr:glycosyltransferase family 2 protein [Bacteroidia bacterium]